MVSRGYPGGRILHGIRARSMVRLVVPPRYNESHVPARTHPYRRPLLRTAAAGRDLSGTPPDVPRGAWSRRAPAPRATHPFPVRPVDAGRFRCRPLVRHPGADVRASLRRLPLSPDGDRVRLLRGGPVRVAPARRGTPRDPRGGGKLSTGGARRHLHRGDAAARRRLVDEGRGRDGPL